MPEVRRRRALPKTAALGCLIAAAMMLSGCAGTVIDAQKAADTIQADLEDSFRERIRAVECPSDQKVEPGATFSCTVDYANGTKATVTLKIRNEDADTTWVGIKPNK